MHVKNAFSTCVSISIVSGMSNQSTSQILVFLSHHLSEWVHQSLCEWSRSHVQLYFTKSEGLCECEKVYMCICTAYIGAYACQSVCNQLCLYFPSHPVLPRRNHPSSEGQVKRTASTRGAVIIMWSPSADQMMWEVGWGIAVRFTFSSAQCTILLRIWL